jgi:hypothetical protein
LAFFSELFIFKNAVLKKYAYEKNYPHQHHPDIVCFQHPVRSGFQKNCVCGIDARKLFGLANQSFTRYGYAFLL